MNLRLSIVLFFACACSLFSQKAPPLSFIQDTMSFNGKNQVLHGEYLEVTLRDQSQVRLFKADDNKVYLRFIVTRNFYFDKVGTLEILSGSKTYSAKEVRQHKISKTRGLFITEIYTNYLTTLKNEGISALIFNQAETKFTGKDRKLVKKMATLFYDTHYESVKRRN